MKIRLLIIALSVVLVAVFFAMPLQAQADEKEEILIPKTNPVGLISPKTKPGKQAGKLTLPGSDKMIIIITGKTGKKFNAEVVGNKLFIIDDNTKKSLAKDGIYKTTDGKTMRVKGGIMHPGSIKGWNPQPEPPIMEYSPPLDDDKSQPPPDDQKSLKLR